MVTMEAAVRQAYCEMPNIDNLVNALMEGRDGKGLLEVCHISLGIPVKPMLAKPSKGISEVAERLGGKRFTGEWKYDGERAQIHVISRDNIKVYSRNSENMTEKYPDVVKVVQDCLCEGVESCIIDSELVAFEQETRKILPFQVLSTRGRKNIVVEDIKINVCLFAFDCMLCNGQPLVTETLEFRRDKLWTMLKETEGKVTMLADAGCQLTKALDMELDAADKLGNVRSKRYAMIVDDGKITKVRKECPNTRQCAPGTFMANHIDRHYCGKCHATYCFKKDE